MKQFLALTATVVFSATFALAGPIAPKDIDANAKWFGHVNAEAIRSMKLYQDMKDMFPGRHQQCQAKLNEMSKQLGMNPMEDVQGATLYSDRYGEQAGVVLIYVKNLDQPKMLAFLKEKHPDHKTSEYGNRTLYSWTMNKHGRTMDLMGAFASDTLMVIGSGEQVKTALDVLDGKKPGLTKDAPLLKDIPDTALFASRGIDVPDDFRKTTGCPVLHNSKSASAFWTEVDGQITGRYEFATVSADAATSFKAIVQGFAAMGQLRYSDIPAVTKVMNGLKVDATGETFTATFNTSTEDVEAAIKAVMEREKARPHHMKDACPMAPNEGEKK